MLEKKEKRRKHNIHPQKPKVFLDSHVKCQNNLTSLTLLKPMAKISLSLLDLGFPPGNLFFVVPSTIPQSSFIDINKNIAERMPYSPGFPEMPDNVWSKLFFFLLFIFPPHFVGVIHFPLMSEVEECITDKFA